MPRVRSLNFDTAYNQTQVNNALDLLISLTDALARLMKEMDSDKKRELWKKNNLTRTLGRKLLQIDANLTFMDPRE